MKRGMVRTAQRHTDQGLGFCLLQLNVCQSSLWSALAQLRMQEAPRAAQMRDLSLYCTPEQQHFYYTHYPLLCILGIPKHLALYVLSYLDSVMNISSPIKITPYGDVHSICMNVSESDTAPPLSTLQKSVQENTGELETFAINQFVLY